MVDRNLVRKSIKRHQRGQRKKYHKMRLGVNVFRILPFKHLLGNFDVIAARCEEEDIGRTIEHFFVDVERLFMGSTFKNALPSEDECPLWQDYWSRPADSRRDYRPSPVFVFNAIDLDERQKGVQLIQVRQSIFLGERTPQGKKIGLGVMDYYDGFDPKKHAEQEETDEEEEGGGGTSLPKLQAYGDALLGLHGRDLLIHMRKGKAFGKEVLMPNNERERGAVTVRKAEACDPIDKHFLKGVKDLWAIPQYYPGFASGKETHLWHHAAEFVELYSVAEDAEAKDDKLKKDPERFADEEEAPGQEPGESGGEDVERAVDADEVVEPEEPTPKPAKKVTRKRTKKATTRATNRKPKPPTVAKFEKGVRVACLDKKNEDNTRVLPKKEWITFVAVFDKYDTKTDGETECWVTIRAADQDDDALREMVERASPEGEAYVRFPQDCVSLIEE